MACRYASPMKRERAHGSGSDACRSRTRDQAFFEFTPRGRRRWVARPGHAGAMCHARLGGARRCGGDGPFRVLLAPAPQTYARTCPCGGAVAGGSASRRGTSREARSVRAIGVRLALTSLEREKKKMRNNNIK